MRLLLNRLSNFSRSRVKTLVTSPQTARANDYIKFTLPAGCIIDPTTLSIHGKISTDYGTATASADYCIPPKFSQCLIQELRVSFNNVLVFQCNEYNQLYAAYMKHLAGDAERNRMSFFEFSRNWTGAAPTADTNWSSIPFFWTGFLGSPLATGNLINTSLTGECLIEIRLAPTSALIAANGTAFTYSITDLSAQYDCVVTDSLYEELILRRLEAGPLEFAFKNYMCSVGSSQTVNNMNHRMAISTKSLDAVWASTLPSDYLTAGNTYMTAIESSKYFYHGDENGRLGTVSLQIGNTMYPQYQMVDASEVAAMTFAGMGILQDTLGSTCELLKGPVNTTGTVARASFLDPIVKGNFIAYFRLNLCPISEIYSYSTLSGINTQGASPFIQVTYRQDASATGSSTLCPWMALEYTSVMRVGKYRQIEVDP